MQEIPTYIVDSFTDEPFKGNPAGVCILEHSLEDEQMLAIAKELGLSETSFVLKLKDSDSYAIRYFSPKMEIPLCGHATLAASKIIFNAHQKCNTIEFITIENIHLFIERVANDFIQMEFPVYDTKPANAPLALLNALGIDKIVNAVFNEETNILVLEIENCNVLQNLKPNFEALYKAHKGINGVLVTSRSTQENYDFESRYFWPWSGTNEDPVTGATHTFLTKYWSERLQKTTMNSFQCSERTGFMEVTLVNNNTLLIKSTAQIILEGSIKL